MTKAVRLLVLELGATEAGRGVIGGLRRLIPDVWIAGVEKQLEYGKSSFDFVVTNQFDAFYGRYPEVDTAALSMTPELHELIAPFEGKLLNVAGLAGVRRPSDYPAPIRGVPVFEDSYDARKDLIDRHIRFWSNRFDELRIDAVVHENLGQEIFDYIALTVARARGIPTLVFNISGQFPRVLFVQEDESTLGDLKLGTEIKGRIGSRLAAESPDFIKRSLKRIQGSPDHGLAPQALNQNTVEYRTHPLISWLFDRSVYKNDVSLVSVSTALVKKFRRVLRDPYGRLRIFRHSRELVKATNRALREEAEHCQEGDIKEPYVFFPLHFQPETSTSIKGRHFYTLREAVAFVASALPPSWRLVVKEHPHQFRRLLKRVPGFYSQIAAIPNVTLVSHHHVNDTLISGAQAVVCVSHSSITAHAALTGKPVISLGDSHLRELPNYFCVRSTSDLHSAIQEISTGLPSLQNQDVERFIHSLEIATFEGEFGEKPDALSSDEWHHVLRTTAQNISLAIFEWLKIRKVVDQQPSPTSSALRW